MSLFDPVAGEAAKDAAIDRVDHHASERWKGRAKEAVAALALTCRFFTTDDVWNRLDGVTTHEPRAMGAVMVWAMKQNLIRKTGRYVKSMRPECHRRPIVQYVGATKRGDWREDETR